MPKASSETVARYYGRDLYLAMVLYHAGDMAGAIMQQHKELIINERCLGLDHPDTAHRHVILHVSFSVTYDNDQTLCYIISVP
ncbi:Clustered mitochondria protein-like protein [Drosera capensis]